MNIYNYRNRGKYWLQFSGNFTEELSYYKDYLMPLMKSLFNHTGNIIKSKKDNSLTLRIYSKAIVNFKINTLKLPFGQKSEHAFIPNFIRNNKKLLSSFLRGLADTDFSLTFKKKGKFHNYPVLQTALKSKSLIKQIHTALNKFNITSNIYFNEKNFDKRTGKFCIKNSLYINGKDNLEKWVKFIGFKNPVFYTKYLIWKKFDFCPPHTTLADRTLILNNVSEISKFKPQ